MPDILEPYISEARATVSRSYVEWCIQQARERSDGYIRARNYYDGDHQTQLTSRLAAFLNVGSDADFTVNYCPLVVNAKADRLRLKGFQTENDDSNKTYWEWARKNRIDQLQGIVHKSAITAADSFILVEWDDVAGIPRYYYEPALANAEGVMVHYSDERRNEMKFASKQWIINYGSDAGKKRRINLYFPDHIEKYLSDDATDGGNWTAYVDESDEYLELGVGVFGQCGWVWNTVSRKAGGDPLGIPIAHFKNDDNGSGYGISHLANVMPLQDVLNKSMIDLVAVMDNEGFGILVANGVQQDTQINVGAGVIAKFSKAKNEAGLDRLQGTNPVGLLSMYNAIVMEIGRVSGTPLSYFQSSGQVAAEGTMKQQEQALVSQVKKSQVDFGNAWEDVMNISRKLNNAFGKSKLNEDVLIETVWESAESRNDLEQAQIAQIKATMLDVPTNQLQLEMGYTEEQIVEFEIERKKRENEAVKKQAQIEKDAAAAKAQNSTQSENENNNGRAIPTREAA